MDKKTEAGDEKFIYTHWNGKSFLADESFARKYRSYFLEQGFWTEDIALLTPERILKKLPEIADDLMMEMVNGEFTA